MQMEINLIPHNLDKMHFKAGLYQNCFNCDLILLVAYLSFNVWFFLCWDSGSYMWKC